MYEKFFGFHRKPFSVTPDPEFFYPSKSHRQGLAHLRYGLRERMGFVVLSGEVGTGKTHLIRLLLRELGPDVRRALILNPVLGPDDLLAAILKDLGVCFDESKGLRGKLEAFVEFLLGEHRAGRRVVIIVDESQNLSIQALERLRLLSNLETASAKLVQIVLVGQPELNLLLNLSPLRQLNQRIVVRHHIDPLIRKEMDEFIAHRLLVAGGPTVEVAFKKGALRLIHTASRGIPRLISILCDYCLVIAFTQESRTITSKMAREAIRLHLGHEIISKPKLLESRLRRRRLIPALAGGLSLVLALGLTVWNLTAHPRASTPPFEVSAASSFPATPEARVSEPPAPAMDVPAMEVVAVPVAQTVPAIPERKEASAPVEAPAPPLLPEKPKVAQIESEPVGIFSDSDLVSAPPTGKEIAGPDLSVSVGPAAPKSRAKSARPPREKGIPASGSSSRRYGIQVASLKTVDAAEKAAEKMNDIGPVFVVPTTSSKGNTWVKIILGAYEDYESAQAMAELLGKEGRAKGALVVENHWWKPEQDKQVSLAEIPRGAELPF
jgi:general secretion pathway protein A